MPSGSLNLFRLGRRGVNVVTAATHLTDDELTSAQNAEVVSDGGEAAIDQRPGMTRINATAINSGASIVVAHDVLAPFLSDYTPYLYAGVYTGGTANWRRSSDGTTWSAVTTPAKPFAANANIAGFFKNFPKAVTVGRYLYFVDGSTPVQLHRFDGTTDTTLSTVPPAVTGAVLSTPIAVYGVRTENETPAAGATTYTYKLVAKQGAFYSAAGTALTTTVGPAALNATNYNAITDVNGGANYIVGAGVTSYDVYRTAGGATQGKIGTIPIVAGAFSRGNGSGASGVSFANNPPTLAVVGGVGATTYTYKLVFKDASGHYGGVTTATTTAAGPAALTVANYIRVIALSANADGQLTTGASCDVYRTAGGGTTGLIGTIAAASFSGVNGLGELHDTGLVGDLSTAPATGSGLYSGVTQLGYPDTVGLPVFSDAGLVGDAAAAPSAASGGAAGDALGVLDMITDGTYIYVAALDMAGADPTLYGRILRFDPTSSVWSQIGATFFTASGNGTAGTLAFFDGALSYGTYIGTTSGNTGYLTSTLNPLPAGGITEIKTTAASLPPCAMTIFNGEVYVGCVSLVAATAAIILKRAAINTWTTVRTGPATAALNAYTSLGVFNGTLFAGWTSGGGATAARIESSVDGVTWALEYTLATTEVVCQMIVFGDSLYVVVGRTGVAYNTTSRILKRTSAAVWSVVDDPADDYAGAIGVVYV